MTEIDTGDKVFHRPSGERWVVAFVKDGEVCPCGWPLSYASIDDCQLREKAPPQKRLALLRSLAVMGHNDPRRHYAAVVLEKEGHANA